MKESKYIHYYVGCDLGKKRDPSTLAVIEASHFSGKAMYLVSFLKRFNLSMLYTDISNKLAAMDKQLKAIAAAQGKEAIITYILDSTGIGGPITETVAKQLPYAKILKVYITGGISTTTAQDDPYEYHVPKGQLISGLMAAFDSSTIYMSKQSKEINAILDELANFEIHISEAGRDAYNAAPSKHDDLVIALALAVWAADQMGDSSTPGFW
jgi:hypothetical protein